MTDDDQPSPPKRRRRKLTSAQVREIRHRYAGGVTMAQLAAEYGVSRIAISSIVRRVLWDRRGT